MENVLKFLNTLKVYDVENDTKIRVGNKQDGGYVVLEGLATKTPLVYSFGIGNDVGFEMDWIRRYPKSKVQCFDPYIEKLPQQHKRFSFRKYGIGSRYKSLTGVVKDSILKMDIEGEEWSAFNIFDGDEVKKFSQIVVEFHILHVELQQGLFSPYFSSVYEDFYEKINEDCFSEYTEVMNFIQNWFRIVHIHANNSLPLVSVDGYRFPPLLEVTFARVGQGLLFEPTKENFPIAGIDFPNKTNRPDVLDYYPFPIMENGNKKKR
jgi:hypothetical protein